MTKRRKVEKTTPTTQVSDGQFHGVLREYNLAINTGPDESISTKSFDIVASMESQGPNTFSADQSLTYAQTIKNLFFSEDWIYIPVDVIANKVSSQSMKVVRKTQQGNKVVTEPADNHPVQARIDNPNPIQTRSDMLYVLAVDEALCGNGVIWNAAAIGQLITIPWENVQLTFDQTTSRVRYMLRQTSESQAVLQGSIQPVLDQSQIIHVRRPNPSNPVVGLSPLLPGSEAMLFNRYTSRFLNNFYEKGATPQMSLSMDKDANEKNALRLLRSFEQAYTGRKNARRTLVLPKGVTAQSLAQSLADQQLIDHISSNRETILALWKVPKQEVALAETGSLGSNETKQALKNFWQATLIPMMRRIEEAFTKAFAQELGDGYVIEFDISDVEALREDEVAKAELAKLMLATHSPNEIRAKLYDDPPIAGGDTLPVPQASAGGFGGLPNVSNQGEGKAITIDAKAGEGVETVTAAEPDVTAPDQAVAKKQMARASAIKSPGGFFEKRQAEFKKKIAPDEESMQKLALDHFSDVALTSIKTVTKFLKEKSYQPGKTKMAHKPLRMKAEGDDDSSSLISKEKLRKALQSAYQGLEEHWVEPAVKILQGTADLGYDTQITVPYKIPNEAQLQALKTQGEKQRRAILEDRELQTFAWMSETTTEKIMQIVEDGVTSALTTQKIAENIADEFTDIDNINSRSLVIARTETLTAASIGQAAADANLSEVIPDLRKTWLSTHDDRTRGPGSVYGWKPGEADHRKLDGEEVGIDEPFSNGLMYPRDPSGDAGDVIQCFPASTIFESVNAEAIYQRIYNGPLITLNFESGTKLIATPNHPVFTPNGWIAVGKLAKGDCVFKTSGFDHVSLNLGQHDVQYIKAEAGQIFASTLNRLPNMRLAGARNDFHGDGSTQDVNIVGLNRSLHDGRQAVGFQSSVNLSFSYPDFGHRGGLSLGSNDHSPAQFIGGDVPGSLVSSSDLTSSSLQIKALPLHPFGFATTALSESSSFEPSNDAGSADAKSVANLKYASHLVEVHTDNIVSVDVVTGRNIQVLNLQTDSGWFIADGVIAHNCRCTSITLPKDYKL